jgi:hypothetical protein
MVTAIADALATRATCCCRRRPVLGARTGAKSHWEYGDQQLHENENDPSHV